MGAFGEDNAIDVPAQQRAQLQLLFLRVVTKVGDQRLIVGFVSDGFNAAQYVSKNLVGERRQQHTDGTAGSVRKHIGGAIGDITQLIQCHCNLVPQGNRDLLRIAQVTADGHFCNADAIGNVL